MSTDLGSLVPRRIGAAAVSSLVEVALKVDVDTHRGLEIGVPRLMRMLVREGVSASFYVAMGPDNSGRAIVRVLRNRGFVSKMMRTRAVGMYGMRTVLSGLLLPSRPVALAFPSLLRELHERGFEVGVHGYDHVRWQDHLDGLGEAGLREEMNDAFEAYRAIFDERARSFAAPGWRVNRAAIDLLDSMDLAYTSNSRGRGPYRCVMGERTFSTPEIPTTLPTLDEVLGKPNLKSVAATVGFYLDRFRDEETNVHTIHAETEGMGQLELFTALVRALKERGARFVRMRDVASRLDRAELPACEVARKTLPGRAGWVSSQGPERTAAAGADAG